jgi:maltooligosyltrehalose trehalohydrolase
MRREHVMPFGAQCLTDGAVRFRLWAPAAERIDLLLDSATFPMPAIGNGWYELVTREAAEGSAYYFLVNGQTRVPDPASRFQPHDVHGPSEVVDPRAFEWEDPGWRGRPWDEAVIYELHVGTFSARGDFAGVEEKLDYLRDLGVTAIELMPVSDFFGKRNWGYDGVLPYAPDSGYGRPEEMKRLVQAAHRRGLMVMLDVVYNHFGPEGNFLRAYAPQFFTARHCTPWGEAINFDGPGAEVVRNYFVHNALYWLEEFHLDGLRFDAVHAIKDDSSPDILTELAESVRSTLGQDRQAHLVLENEDNEVRYLDPRSAHCATPCSYDAQWNDDIHHVCHVLASHEQDGYYEDYARHPIEALGKCLTEGFYFQGQASSFRGGARRGEVSRGLSPTRFVSFLQNHDQVGNRATGGRILSYASPDAVRAVMAILLLAPSPPLLFMGEEFGAKTPFLFFCDFQGDLAKAVTEGRRAEFSRFKEFRDASVRDSIPDPNAESTFLTSKLDWRSLREPEPKDWLKFYSALLALRQKAIIPFLREAGRSDLTSGYSSFSKSGLCVRWKASTQALQLITNLSDVSIDFAPPQSGAPMYATFDAAAGHTMPAWSVAWYLNS